MYVWLWYGLLNEGEVETKMKKENEGEKSEEKANWVLDTGFCVFVYRDAISNI